MFEAFMACTKIVIEKVRIAKLKSHIKIADSIWFYAVLLVALLSAII